MCGGEIFLRAHCDLVLSVAIHKRVIIPERIKLPLLLSLHWISCEWPTLMLVSCSFSYYLHCNCSCICVCSPIQTPRWHIDLEPWASESQSLEDEAKRFLSYITTQQVRFFFKFHLLPKCIFDYYSFKMPTLKPLTD